MHIMGEALCIISEECCRQSNWIRFDVDSQSGEGNQEGLMVQWDERSWRRSVPWARVVYVYSSQPRVRGGRDIRCVDNACEGTMFAEPESEIYYLLFITIIFNL